MGEIEKRAGMEPTPLWKYIPSAALLSIGLIFWDIQMVLSIALMAIGIASLAIPTQNYPKDIDSWKIAPFTQADKNYAVMHTVIPAAAFAGNIFIEDSPLGLPPLVSSIGLGVAFGVSTVFAVTRTTAVYRRKTREHVELILRNSSLEEVTTSDLDALDHPEPRILGRALLAHGAIDGTRVMARQLAKVLDWSVEQVHEVARPLDKHGITSRSTIMSGGDPAKIYVELTEKGVVLLSELRRGR